MQINISKQKLPLAVTLELMVMLKESTEEDKEDAKLIKPLRFEWQPNEEPEFLNILCHQTSETMLSKFEFICLEEIVSTKQSKYSQKQY